MKFLRSQTHQWIRHLVQLSVLLSIVAVAFAALMVELPRPVLMYCRSGARSSRLYVLAQAI